jgi:Methyltransferase FkbM domain
MVRPNLPRRISSKIATVSKRDGLLVGAGAAVGILITMMLMLLLLDRSSTSTGGRIAFTTTKSPETATIATRDSLPSGMHPLYVYYGQMDLITDSIPNQWWLSTDPHQQHTNIHGEWFAQHGQDIAVAKFHHFKRNGYFVDLAANDAIWASNTFSLEQNFGWQGICIEANSYYWWRLSFRQCHVVGAIVGGRDGEPVEVALGQGKVEGPYGGIVGDEFDNKKKNQNKKPVVAADPTAASSTTTTNPPEKRYTLSLATILKTFAAPPVIDYLSLDVEGAESFILRDFPFDQYRFLTITIERPKDDLRTLLMKHGYRHVLDFRRGDTLWAHESVYDVGKPLTEIDPMDIDQHKITGPMPGVVETTTTKTKTSTSTSTSTA